MATFVFPDTNGIEQEIHIADGHTLFIVGANGSGKSSLLQRLFTQHRNNATRISAHRQTWFTSNTLDFTPTSREQTGISLQQADVQEDARWKDSYASKRLSAAIFDLINAENVRSRKIAETIDMGALEAALSANEKGEIPQIVADALAQKKEEAPLKVLNELLKVSNLPIDISIENGERLFAKRLGSAPYSIAELSDGERNAILVGANVLTAAPGTVIIIDEPERHLHRSIVSPLMSTLFQRRLDCVFVISTHDVFLPMDNTESTTLLIRSCSWKGRSASGWDTDLLEHDAEISEDVKRAILGARRIVLFVEGSDNSLDKQIYEILFSDISIIAKGGATDVERATKGIRATTALNWVTAYGLIDADDRTPDQLEELKDAGIYGLNCYSVESLYYHPIMISLLAVKQAQITGEDANKLEGNAWVAAMTSIQEHRDRLCARMVEKRVRQEISRDLPDHQFIAVNDVFGRQVDLRRYRESEYARFDELMTANDLGGLIARYPIRETPALGRIAARLNFQTTGKYEMAVREALVAEDDARNALRGLLGGLAAVLNR
ncbi:MAG: AAA family ATPase [Gemmatimonadota bacterium]|nr:AAA family ATPase [Gemmatimonadota bacterium]MDE2863458.1 AAA family ATPase [Gemmatimonadota bacterium]